MRPRPVFCALLTPYTSLSSSGLRWVVGLYLALTLIPGLFFLFNGAWPVVGFLGFDVWLVWWALNTSKKNGKAFQEVTLWRDGLEILSVNAKGLPNKVLINPFWVKLKLRRNFDNQITNIFLQTRQEIHEVGSFLNPADKTSFAHSFGRALARVKN